MHLMIKQVNKRYTINAVLFFMLLKSIVTATEFVFSKYTYANSITHSIVFFEKQDTYARKILITHIELCMVFQISFGRQIAFVFCNSFLLFLFFVVALSLNIETLPTLKHLKVYSQYFHVITNVLLYTLFVTYMLVCQCQCALEVLDAYVHCTGILIAIKNQTTLII